VTEQSYAKLAIEENVDGLVHVFLDEPPSPDVVALAAKRKIFVAPTLTVAESATAVASGKSLTEDPRLAPYLMAEEIDNLRSTFPNKGGLVLGNAVAAVGRATSCACGSSASRSIVRRSAGRRRLR
jgi:hypothetical protein